MTTPLITHAFTPQITAAIAAYENATTLAERIIGFGVLEQMENTERLNGRFDVSNAIHLELMRIGKDTRVMDAMDAASPFSKANWAKAKAARETLTQSQAA